jgi:hypothetical protein
MSEGARLVGRSKGTLSKALTSGRMSYVEKTDAGYLIDTSELFRAFPPKPLQPGHEARPETLIEPPVNEGLRVEVQLLREQLADTRADRDAWRDQAQRLLLEAPSVVVAAAPDPAQPEPRPRRWWRPHRD